MTRSPVSVILITHDDETRRRAVPVIEALLRDPEGPAEVVLVDNSGGEEAKEMADRLQVKLVPRTGGFSDGCNAGVRASGQPFIALLGHDTIPGAGWLKPLIAVLERPDVAAAIPTVEDGSRPGRFNTSGGHLTYVGLAWVSDLGKPIPDEEPVAEVDFPCGGAMVMSRAAWDRFQGFRDEYFIYQEDSDLGWRIRLAGMRTVRVPQSRVVHDYEFGRQPDKMFLLERNRLITVLSNYRRRTLAVLAPCLLLVELGILLVSVRDGWLRAKVRGWRWVWANRALIARGRELADRNRRIGDAEMLRSMRYRISTMPEVELPRPVAVVDWFLGGYRALAVPVVSVLDRL